MAIKTFEHILILAKDIEVTKSFYVDILGLETGYRPNFPFHGYWLYVKNHSDACIHMAMQKSNDGQDYFIGTKQISDGTGPIDHIAFNADNMEEMKKFLENKSIKYNHRIVPGAPLQQLFITDPDGIKVELNFPL